MEGERACEICGVDLVGRRIYRTRFCYSCAKARQKKASMQAGRNRAARFRKEGRCRWCGEKITDGTSLCPTHRRLYREKARKSYRKFNKPEFIPCGTCGLSIRKRGNVKFCPPCAYKRNKSLYARNRRERRRAIGTCQGCGKSPAREGRSYCEACGAAHLRLGKARYQRMKEGGLCTQCGKRPRGKTLRCEECRMGKKRKWMGLSTIPEPSAPPGSFSRR